jgi:hypothetical protein
LRDVPPGGFADKVKAEVRKYPSRRVSRNHHGLDVLHYAVASCFHVSTLRGLSFFSSHERLFLGGTAFPCHTDTVRIIIIDFGVGPSQSRPNTGLVLERRDLRSCAQG